MISQTPGSITVSDIDAARARTAAGLINLNIIRTCATRRALINQGMGERAPAGPARRVMVLQDLTEENSYITDGPRGAVVTVKSEPVTKVGFRTAVIRIPKVLERMAKNDPRRIAAERYAEACEKIQSLTASGGGEASGGGSVSDGGATTRIVYATVIRAVIGAVNAWPRNPETGHYIRRQALEVLPVQNVGRDRVAVTAQGLIDNLCLDGLALSHIATRAGWCGSSRTVGILTAAAEAALERMADALGLGAGVSGEK